LSNRRNATASESRRVAGAKASALRRLAGGEASVETVVKGLHSEGYGTDESVKALRALQTEKKVNVIEARPYSALGAYLWSPLSLWFWAALGAVALSIVLISVTSGVIIYLRYVFGSALVLFLPGYALIEALYPKGELDGLLRFALSIGLSLAISPLTGLVLNFTPFGISLLPVTISIAGITAALLFVAITRKHAYYKLAKGVL